ncbi:MAG: HNH endonuclease signature motif containing protein, partial [Terracoccus sp.]
SAGTTDSRPGRTGAGSNARGGAPATGGTPDAGGGGLCGSGDVLSPETVRRWACDAEIIPVVLGSQSQPLDVGRSRRLVTPAIRTALWLRDRGCTFPGDAAPATWTDAHHVTHWADGGPTALSNLALLCRRHHSHVHQRHLTATITDTTVTWNTWQQWHTHFARHPDSTAGAAAGREPDEGPPAWSPDGRRTSADRARSG